MEENSFLRFIVTEKKLKLSVEKKACKTTLDIGKTQTAEVLAQFSPVIFTGNRPFHANCPPQHDFAFDHFYQKIQTKQF